MNDHVDRWGTSNFANHLWWHTALFHLDIEDADGVLDIFDQHLNSEGKTGDKYEELDAVALLWRLKLVGYDVGSRWEHLANKWEPSAEDTLYAFNDVHAMMAYVAADCIAPGSRLHAQVRARSRSVSVCRLPFVPQRYYRGG